MARVSADAQRSAGPAASPPGGDGRRGVLRRAAPGLLAAALAALYLLWQPASLDLAAGEYRAWLFGRAGWAVWDLQWYGGHHLPGYSVLLPPLAWLLGPRLLGALCAVAAAVLFDALARGRWGERALLGSLWFAAGTLTLLLSGRMTFALGLVPALGALLALQRRSAAPRGARRAARTGLAVALALLTPLASPVAALFLALAAVAWGIGEPRAARWWTGRRALGLALAVAALVPVLALAVAFPEGGREPFALSAFAPVPAVAAAAWWLLGPGERTLRAGVALYLLGCAAAFALDTPVGGNATRLGALCAGPLLALALWPRRRLALALLAAPLLWWQWTAAVRDVRAAAGDPSVEAAFYAPLNAFLDREAARLGPGAGRVEIPFTKLHWEARHVAPRHPLARGWERQLDTKVNAVFYDGDLTPARYRAWLERMAVRWVALPDTALDGSAVREAALVRAGLPYLEEVWRGGAWRVFAVRDPAPLASGPARIVAQGPDAVTLRADAPGTVRLRIHWTPYWDVVRGAACVARDGAFTRVEVRRPGTVALATRFALGRIGAGSPRCRER